MRALLRGKREFDNVTKEFVTAPDYWVDIETDCLFNNQYNTKDKRIYDADIIKIVDDVRAGLGTCGYCGKIIKKGEEEQHFLDVMSKPCEKCFYFRNVTISKEETKSETEKITELGENGQERITTVIKHTYVDIIKKQCTYKDEQRGTKCTNECCRNYKIKWFTPENTFFLKYPNGYNANDEETINKITFDFISDCADGYQIYYKKRFGSYKLSYYKGEKQFRISNCRNDIWFNIVPSYDNGKIVDFDILVYDNTFGYESKKSFKKYHETIKCNDELKKFILNRLTK